MILVNLGWQKRVALFNDAQLCETVTLGQLNMAMIGHGTFVTAWIKPAFVWLASTRRWGASVKLRPNLGSTYGRVTLSVQGWMLIWYGSNLWLHPAKVRMCAAVLDAVNIYLCAVSSNYQRCKVIHPKMRASTTAEVWNILADTAWQLKNGGK